MEIYLEARSVKSRCGQVIAAAGGSRAGSFRPLPALVLPASLACGRIPPGSVSSKVTWPSSCVCVSALLLRTPLIGFKVYSGNAAE